MTEQRQYPSEEEHLKKLREQWDKEWGPEISPWKRRLAVLFVFGAFVALMAIVVLSVP